MHYVSVCSPNYLHDAHMRLALRVGADVICEKPLVINPWNLDALAGARAARPGAASAPCCSCACIRSSSRCANGCRRDPSSGTSVQLTYITARGRWYDVSWKGHEERSGGIVTNIGIHFFDLLVWLFGPVQRSVVHLREPSAPAACSSCERADVQWFLSTDSVGPAVRAASPASKTTFRSITVDGEQIEFSEGFTDLHTRVYEEVLAGRGFGIAEARPSIELTLADPHAPIARRAVTR